MQNHKEELNSWMEGGHDVRMGIGVFLLQTDMIKAHCFLRRSTILHEEKMASAPAYQESAPAYQQPAPACQQSYAMQDSRYIIILNVFLHNSTFHIYIYIYVECGIV